MAKSFGTVTLVVWSKAGQRNFYNITVEQNLEPLRQLLKETVPERRYPRPILAGFAFAHRPGVE